MRGLGLVCLAHSLWNGAWGAGAFLGSLRRGLLCRGRCKRDYNQRKNPVRAGGRTGLLGFQLEVPHVVDLVHELPPDPSVVASLAFGSNKTQFTGTSDGLSDFMSCAVSGAHL
jgi:hypothetical protein